MPTKTNVPQFGTSFLLLVRELLHFHSWLATDGAQLLCCKLQNKILDYWFEQVFHYHLIFNPCHVPSSNINDHLNTLIHNTPSITSLISLWEWGNWICQASWKSYMNNFDIFPFFVINILSTSLMIMKGACMLQHQVIIDLYIQLLFLVHLYES